VRADPHVQSSDTLILRTRNRATQHAAVEVKHLRRLLLFVLLCSLVGIAIELLLLEHTESLTQWIPLALVAASVLTIAAAATWPRRPALLLMRAVMLLCVAAGALGLFLHYRGNVEFELEMNPALKGYELFRKTMMGATPTLSPGLLSQLGLLGLLYTYRHPGLGPADTSLEES
jgi:hypothetical protein